MNRKRILSIPAFILSFVCLVLITSAIAQVSQNEVSSINISPSGTSEEQAGQLLLWWDENKADSIFQITNANDTTAVTVHIQIFDGTVPGCAEVANFNDFLTPNDTDIFDLDDFTSSGAGFIVVTPIVSNLNPFSIAFNHLLGHSELSFAFDIYSLNAMGRTAVEQVGGGFVPAADNSVLDGFGSITPQADGGIIAINSGFMLIQPERLAFNFSDLSAIPNPANPTVGLTINVEDAQVVSIAFLDNYNFSVGEPGYRALPGDAVWSPRIFDQFEFGVSCPDALQNCFLDVGLNPFFPGFINPGFLCPGSSDRFGWTRIGVAGLTGFENEFGLFATAETTVTGSREIGGADWMFAERLTAPPAVSPPPGGGEVPGDPASCFDTIDNDGDGDIDCADQNCDNVANPADATQVCEFDTERTCDDGFDNDADGLVDIADPDCVVVSPSPPVDGDGGGGGCAVAGPVSIGTAMANLILPLIPVAFAFGLGALRRRNRKEDK